MDFWRGEAYEAFFNYLDRTGGFYYEVRRSPPTFAPHHELRYVFRPYKQRWGDAPVHSIAAALFAGKDRIQFFREIGYEHAPYTHCPAEERLWEQARCSCDPLRSFGKVC